MLGLGVGEAQEAEQREGGVKQGTGWKAGEEEGMRHSWLKTNY